LPNFQTQNTVETRIPNPQGQIVQKQRANDMFSTMLTLLQQQAARLSYVEQNQQIISQMMNNHVQSNLHNALQDETLS
jgi:hypothetical protein